MPEAAWQVDPPWTKFDLAEFCLWEASVGPDRNSTPLLALAECGYSLEGAAIRTLRRFALATQ